MQGLGNQESCGMERMHYPVIKLQLTVNASVLKILFDSKDASDQV